MDTRRALQLSLGCLLAAVLFRHSLLGVLAAAVAAVPAAYVVWLEAQRSDQRAFVLGIILTVGSLLMAVLLFLVWLFT
jgi:hypothetical protein